MKVYFFKAPWCSACHAIEDVVPSDVVHVDCNEEQGLAENYHVSGLPVFIAVDDIGNEIDRIQTTNMADLGRWIGRLEETQNG